ncbi:MAG: PTS sugar transporter subunit IIC [Gemmatimonadota bacterium]|nr:PTS sugar transporter subunit IIC [Gemmatimonadota bacterium]
MIGAELLPLALLGGVLGLDVVSFPQAMISRPIVAATLGGAFAGDAVSGLLIGAVLELIALDTLPLGASRYPEWGSASVVGGALFAEHSAHPSGSMGVAVLATLAAAWIGGWTMVMLRGLNGRWARQRRDALAAGSRDAVIGLQLLGLTADLMRGSLFTAVAYAILAPTASAAIGVWGVDARLSRAVVVGAAITVAAGAAWKIFHSTLGVRWTFLAGLAAGTVAAAFR